MFFILFIAAIGIALGMTPLVGELYAQGDREKSAGLLQNGILFYTLLGFAMAVVQYSVIPLMYRLGQPSTWSMRPSPTTVCWFSACRS